MATNPEEGVLREARGRILAALACVFFTICFSWPSQAAAAGNSLLAGRVTSVKGEPLAGIPVRAQHGNIIVSVYSNRRGEYAYPSWSELKPGTSTVSVELPDFEAVKHTASLESGRTTQLDLKLTSRTPSVEDVTASEIIDALPGTDEEKHLFIQCDNCHSLQHALRVPRDKEGWTQIIRRMMGERRANANTPNTRAYTQKQYIEPLAAYLARIRGPGSPHEIPFQLRPRPTAPESTNIVVTEFNIPRMGSRANIIRGDTRAAWPHDILVEPDGPYAYYTDHFSYNLGRLDRRTGKVEELPYQHLLLEGMGRQAIGMVTQAQRRAGNPGGGGAHDMQFDSKGNVVFGLGNGIFRFNPRTEEFTPYMPGDSGFGLDGNDNAWIIIDKGFFQINLDTGEVTEHDVPDYVEGATYDKESDKQGRTFFNMYRESAIGMYDPATEQFSRHETPTHGSGPRRGDVDDQGRPWMGLYWAGRIGRFDPDTRQMKEFSLIPGHVPYARPFLSPYSVAVDDANQIVWTNDFNSRRTYMIDLRTEKSIEYLMPLPYEVRDITVEDNAPRPTVWIPAYRPPSKMVRIEIIEDGMDAQASVP